MSKLAPLGSLLDLINVTNKDKTIAEPLALHLTAEVFQTFCLCLVRQYHLFQILELVHQLHLMDLIHADLKPDNFLVTDLPGMGLQYPFLKYIPSYIKLLFRPSQSGFANDRLRESFRHAAGNLTHYQDEYCTFFSDSRAHCLHRPSLDLWTSVRRDARASSLASSH